MNIQSTIHHAVPAQLSIHHASLLRPFKWLALAWQDITQYPQASLAHGAIVASLAFVTLLITSVHLYVVAAAITGFTLVGPILAAGLCELSLLKERGSTVSFDESVANLTSKQGALSHFASILLSISLVWLLVSSLVLFATVGNVVPTIEQVLWGNFFDTVTPLQVTLYTVIGGLLAAIVFFLSVVTVPAMIDNSVTAQQAIATSMEVVIENPATMFVWAVLVSALTILGFVTFLVGMVVIYPVLGHATWHAYRDLVEKKAS